MDQSKLCVCGRSALFPICDGSHVAEDWVCATDITWANYGFCASYRYENLVRKLAAHYQGVTCLAGEPFPALETLVIIVDGTDLEFPVEANRQIRAKQRLVVTLGIASPLLSGLFPGCQIVNLAGVDVFQSFKRICTILDESGGNGQLQDVSGDGPIPAEATLKSAFISHAVKDEPLIMPVIDYLRRYFQVDLFTCADSIPASTHWQAEIIDALRTKDTFVALLSQATLTSHFCSFEIGMAYALKASIILISLDGSRPPVFVQHLQTLDLTRLERQKRWLDRGDLLLDELLKVLS